MEGGEPRRCFGWEEDGGASVSAPVFAPGGAAVDLGLFFRRAAVVAGFVAGFPVGGSSEVSLDPFVLDEIN